MRRKGKLANPVQHKQAQNPKGVPAPANLQQLAAGLREANSTLQDDSRGAAIAALNAVMDFIHSVPILIDQNLGTSIWALLAALQDLNSGRVVPMLAPTRKARSRRPDALIRKVAKAYAVLSVDLLQREGSRPMEACRLVAKELKDAGFVLGGRRSTPDWKTVKSWRDRLSRLPPNDQMRETVDALRGRLPEIRFESLDDAKTRVLGRLRSLLEHEMGKAALE